jgi:hypothetical protein
MSVRSVRVYKTKQKSEALKNKKPSVRTCFWNNKFERSHNRSVMHAWKLSGVVEWLINCKIFSNFNFQVSFEPPLRTDRKVFW